MGLEAVEEAEVSRGVATGVSAGARLAHVLSRVSMTPVIALMKVVFSVSKAVKAVALLSNSASGL